MTKIRARSMRDLRKLLLIFLSGLALRNLESFYGRAEKRCLGHDCKAANSRTTSRQVDFGQGYLKRWLRAFKSNNEISESRELNDTTLNTSPREGPTDWISNQTRVAEESWLEGKGYIWLQHSRKAGGTTLCMILRENTRGLVQLSRDQRLPLRRETCQLENFCSDCDLKKRYPHSRDLLNNVRYAMFRNGRNFIEVEGSGVPEHITSEMWSDFVFISSVRHPLARIESALRNDDRYKVCMPSNSTYANNDSTTAACLSRFVDTNITILQQCASNGIYHCLSNYYVRMFSGREKSYTIDAEMLALAQKNFLRFSCVILQEDWESSQTCLWRKLGLTRRPTSAFNVQGRIDKPLEISEVQTSAESSSWWNVSDLLHPNDQERIISLNQADLIFYEWAREQILLDR